MRIIESEIRSDNPDPHWYDDNSKIIARWDHPEQGIWILYKQESDSGIDYYEFSENKQKSDLSKVPNTLKQLDRDMFEKQVQLLKRNRKFGP